MKRVVINLKSETFYKVLDSAETEDMSDMKGYMPTADELIQMAQDPEYYFQLLAYVSTREGKTEEERAVIKRAKALIAKIQFS